MPSMSVKLHSVLTHVDMNTMGSDVHKFGSTLCDVIEHSGTPCAEQTISGTY